MKRALKIEELKEVAKIMNNDSQVPKIVISSVSMWKMGHFACDCRFKWRTAQGNTTMSCNLGDDIEEEWAIELSPAVIDPVEEAEEEDAMLPVSKEIEEKTPESMEEQFGKYQFTITNELQSFEDEGE